eukprot:gnl/TRDRNA2_/TRDRNA2_157165_c1_seq2.p1 gnl/TRDRNA2_/TRDRNA2_157165_c1~~gnl/TRDRNA2_/TRDRNA2_157165_c1_seq2.p1  ORF type:complete len:159 (+),score=25.06 gnl/TRDRNA2_/TRDRNA2_157165_c1_seq2:59-478(+)
MPLSPTDQRSLPELLKAERIRLVLAHWALPHGGQHYARHHFAYCDMDRDGKLQWSNSQGHNEIRKFVDIALRHQDITSPPWSDAVWYEMFRRCNSHAPHTLQLEGAMEFCKYVLEAMVGWLEHGCPRHTDVPSSAGGDA